MASHLFLKNKDLLCSAQVAELSGYDGGLLLANILLSKKAGKTPMIPYTWAESLRAAPFPDSAAN